MSDRPGVADFDDGAPDAEEVQERHVVLRFLKRSRAALVLVPLVVGLVVAAGIGAQKLWAEVPERAIPVTEVVCWDGSRLPETDCTEPRGPAGLRWVFPSFRPSEQDCRQVERGQRPTAPPWEFSCETSYDLRPVTITYSIRNSVDAGLEFLERTYGGPARELAGGERLVFASSRARGGIYSTTVAYADHPFSVTVQAPALDVRDGALAELVDLRPAGDLRVRPGR